MQLVNLCPHVVNVILENGQVTDLVPSGTVARCSQSNETVMVIDGIAVTRQIFGEVQNLPEPEEGVCYVVSRLVAAARPDRKDLLIPGPLVRDENGQPKGCQGLSIL